VSNKLLTYLLKSTVVSTYFAADPMACLAA